MTRTIAGRLATALLVLSRAYRRDTDSESRLAASLLSQSATLRRRLARLRRPRAACQTEYGRGRDRLAAVAWTYTARRARG